MKIKKLSNAIAVALSVGVTANAYAIELYVDTKSKQIYAEPGPGRVLMGEFERVGEQMQGTAETADMQKVQQDLEMKTNEINALKEHMAEAEKVKVHMDKKGLKVESADKDFSFRFGGRIHADSTFHSGDNFAERDDENNLVPIDANDGTEIRRARMRMEGVFFKDWLFRTEADFADDNVRVKDAFIEYSGIKDWFYVTVGQQKQNFSRELQESSNDMMFTERSLMNILNNPTVDRAIGVNFQHFDKNWMAKLGIYGDSITPARTGTATEIDNAADEGWGISSRVVYNPILEKTKLIHLGVAGNYRIPDDSKDIAKSRGLALVYETTNMSNLDLVNKSISNVSDIKQLGLEAAGLYGPFSVGAEYTRMWVDRNNGDNNLELDGWYGEVAYAITGESRGYKDGNFGYLTPNKPFSLKNGGLGAWELAARYSSADLNDGDFDGGELSNITVALNWYINSNFRLMANYTRMLDIERAAVLTSTGGPLSGDHEGLDTFTIRGQVAF